jgi:lysyl-tRNA synthetase, class II
MDQQPPSDEISVRRAKLDQMHRSGVIPYAERFPCTHGPAEASRLPDGTRGVAVAGRVVSQRILGKLIFAHVSDADGRVQLAVRKDQVGPQFDRFRQFVDTGDYVGVEGGVFTTKTGEKTIDVERWTLLSKALRPLPEKFHGMTDKESILRKRYLDLIGSRQTVERFRVRTRLVQVLRRYLDQHGFTEIDTPILTNKASGALATPFQTHHNALDIDVYLRIAPETYLKRAVAGGFNRVYEIARCFRNEGMDASHLPDFTMLEFYAAYWNYEDNMDFTERLLKHLVAEVTGGHSVKYSSRTISFDGDWPRFTFRDLILRDAGIDLASCPTKESLLAAMASHDLALEIDAADRAVSYGTLVDQLFKKVSRPKIVQPLFVTGHPVDVSPLARRNDADPTVVDRFQLVVNGWEIVNAYSELIDPVDQRQRLAAQMEARAAGDMETMEMDEDFLLCMEHGMPPMSGWGMGIDRLVALLTDAETLRDVILFPLMRPE